MRRTMISPDPQPSAAPGPDDVARFLDEMSVLLGLPAGSGREVLAGSSPFWGTGGLMCRLQVASGRGEAMAVQPQVMLPMAAQDLQGQGVGRLLDLQAAVILETGWSLGVSREGMVQLSLLSWINEPVEAVEALDTGNAVALQTLSLLLDDVDDSGDGAAHGGELPLSLVLPRGRNTCH